VPLVGRRPGGVAGARRGARRLPRGPGLRRRRRRLAAQGRRGVPPRARPAAAQSEVIGAVNDAAASATSWCRRPAACPVTCSCSGGPGTRSSTTSSTATPAWASRSPAPSA
jgi:hypothetical protein